ncbi:hypothetical protein NF27_BK00200 [Candidatus Jidaibacter acanthamoeba]|uniref:Porin domain-containing protein n=2 Tax=Candidatus Jidaibacter acanthamoebae TaxID=86105 RepID=A0A0C1QKS8_9RICK|nr:hypothetical protein NF27_BK00200 [Candidatus Jidaibacter acanthamoeba]
MIIMYKKITLSAILSVIAAAANAAEPPTVKLGGRFDTMVGHVRQTGEYRDVIDNNTFQNKGKGNRSAIVNDTKIDINIDGVTDSELKYGGLIRLNADTSKSTANQSGIAEKTMAYIQHDSIGRLEGGNYYGAGGVFEMDTTAALAKAAYGVDGFWSKWASETAYIDLSGVSPFLPFGLTKMDNLSGYKFIVSPNLPSNYSAQYYASAPKLTAYTMPHPTLTIGVSFIPDMDSTGSVATRASRDDGPVDTDRKPIGIAGNRPTFKNIISGGVQFKHNFNQEWNIKAGLVGEIGKAKKFVGTDLLRDLKAYEAGLAIGYQDFVIGGTYGSWMKTGTYKTKLEGTKQGSQYWTLGAAYQYGNLGYSLNFMKSKKAGGLESIGTDVQRRFVEKSFPGAAISPNKSFSDTTYNKFTNISLGVEYKVAPGFMPYAEASRFHFKDANAPKSNQGVVYLIGTRLTF